MKITILIFDNFTALDITGPYEIFVRLPEAELFLAGIEKKLYSDQFGLKMFADYTIDEISETDILVIPGGTGVDSVLKNSSVITWIKKIHETTEWTASVCSGSLLLAEAGLLENRECTTHWMRREQLAKYNVIIKNERYVRDGKIITSAGVSAGIDMALYLAGKISNDHTAQMIQLGIEYDPQPPYDSGSPGKVPAEILQKLTNKNTER